MVTITSEPISGYVNHYCRKWALDTEESRSIAFYIMIDFKTKYKNVSEGSEDPPDFTYPVLSSFQSDEDKFSGLYLFFHVPLVFSFVVLL